MSAVIDLSRYRKWKEVVKAIEGRCRGSLWNARARARANYRALSVRVQLSARDVFIYDFADPDLDSRAPVELADSFFEEFQHARKTASSH